MFVITGDGRIEYAAVSPFKVDTELNKFYADLENLLNADLNVQEIFYYASLLHLVFVKIHPFDDGNGRTSRLIEKWFLAEKLGEKAWLIQSEKNIITTIKCITRIFDYWVLNMNNWIILNQCLFTDVAPIIICREE